MNILQQFANIEAAERVADRAEAGQAEEAEAGCDPSAGQVCDKVLREADSSPSGWFNDSLAV